MKQILLLYVTGLALCLVFGIVVATIKFWHPLCAFLLSIPISFTWLPFAEISKRLERNFDLTTAWYLVAAFVALVLLFVLCATTMGSSNFWSVTVACSFFAAILLTMVVLIRVRNTAILMRMA